MNIPAALLAVLTVISCMSAFLLVVAASKKPHIGALTERAIIGVFLAFFGVLYTLVAADTEFGRVILSTDEARFVSRAAVVMVLSIPTVWMVLYVSGRLGDNGKGGTDG